MLQFCNTYWNFVSAKQPSVEFIYRPKRQGDKCWMKAAKQESANVKNYSMHFRLLFRSPYISYHAPFSLSLFLQTHTHTLYIWVCLSLPLSVPLSLSLCLCPSVRPTPMLHFAPFTTLKTTWMFWNYLTIDGTERSPKGRFSCRGMLDFVEDFWYWCFLALSYCGVSWDPKIKD